MLIVAWRGNGTIARSVESRSSSTLSPWQHALGTDDVKVYGNRDVFFCVFFLTMPMPAPNHTYPHPPTKRLQPSSQSSKPCRAWVEKCGVCSPDRYSLVQPLHCHDFRRRVNLQFLAVGLQPNLEELGRVQHQRGSEV